MRVVLILFAMAWVLVLGAYFWPSSMGRGCPQLLLTAQEIRSGAHSAADVEAAGTAAHERWMCLSGQLNEDVLRPTWPEPLQPIESMLIAIFKADDMRIWRTESEAASAAQDAAWDFADASAPQSVGQ